MEVIKKVKAQKRLESLVAIVVIALRVQILIVHIRANGSVRPN